MHTSTLKEEWIVPFQRGVDSVFTKVMEVHQPNLIYFASQLTGDQQEAEDIVMKTFHILWNMRSQFESFAKVKAFLYISTKNACLNYIKRKQWQQSKTMALIDQTELSDETYLELKYETEMQELLKKEVDKLTGNIKAVMKLALFENLKNQQIAARLGISVGAVETYKGRGILRLKERIKDHKGRFGLNNWLLTLLLYWMIVYLLQWYFGAL